ncbi:hypothetical protein A3715_17800 [Oleiphilus sp. HI0009]|nr:hypothetical protein A3715_17800 [Oleiphilus sp. HI0009]
MHNINEQLFLNANECKGKVVEIVSDREVIVGDVISALRGYKGALIGDTSNYRSTITTIRLGNSIVSAIKAAEIIIKDGGVDYLIIDDFGLWQEDEIRSHYRLESKIVFGGLKQLKKLAGQNNCAVFLINKEKYTKNSQGKFVKTTYKKNQGLKFILDTTIRF